MTNELRACVGVMVCLVIAAASPAVSWGAPSITIKGDAKVGSTLTGKALGGKASKFLWERCEGLVSGSSCSKLKTLGRRQTLVLKPADATRRIRLTATVGGKKVSSRWTKAVAESEPEADALGMTVGNPVSLGSSLLLPDGWKVQVDSYNGNATDAVITMGKLVESMPSYNTAPSAGYQYVLIKLTVTNLTGAAATYEDVRVKLANAGGVLVGAQGALHITDDLRLLAKNVAPGASATGYVCLTIPIADAYSVVMVDNGFFTPNGYRFFELNRRVG